jgi:hypothetical protein
MRLVKSSLVSALIAVAGCTSGEGLSHAQTPRFPVMLTRDHIALLPDSARHEMLHQWRIRDLVYAS